MSVPSRKERKSKLNRKPVPLQPGPDLSVHPYSKFLCNGKSKAGGSGPASCLVRLIKPFKYFPYINFVRPGRIVGTLHHSPALFPEHGEFHLPLSMIETIFDNILERPAKPRFVSFDLQ